MERADYPLILIGMGKVVEGATRLQKYAFLSAMKIKKLHELDFYDDWVASHYGPFSRELASDLNVSVMTGKIGKYKVKNAYGYDVERFSLMDGREKVDQFMREHPPEYKQMQEIIDKYQAKSLSELLQDVYFQYPQYAKSSEIKAEVGKKIYESDSYLSTNYDFPASEY